MTAKTDNILTESRPLIDTIVILSAEIESLREENIALKEDLAQAEEDRSMNENRAEAYWSAISQRDEARFMYCDFVSKSNPAIHGSPLNVAQSQGWGDLFPFEVSTTNRTKRSDFKDSETEQRSDSDPVTGVQYGDLV